MGKKKKRAYERYFDYSLLFVTIFIVGFGLIMIYSTSSYTAQLEYGRADYYFRKQLFFVLGGLVCMYITYRMDYHKWRNWALAIFIVSILLIIALIPFGSAANGAKRWIRFGGVGIQPADIAKFAVIIMASASVCSMGKKMKKLRYVFKVCLLTAGILAAMVLVISNNMSSAIIIVGIAAVITFVAYPGYRIYIAFVVLAVLALIPLKGILTNYFSSGDMTQSFRFNRIMVWLDPEKYASGTGYQTVQALYAIGSGGLFGKGLGKSLQKLGFIPESQNDMIFSIICEELGLFGAICVILLFMIMLWRIVHIAQNAPDLFGSLVAVGVFAHIAIQVVLNIAVVTNFIPNTGVSLPIISYGGTSAIIIMTEIGIVLNISSKIRLEK